MPNHEKETRTLATSLSFREAAPGSKGTVGQLFGYAAKYSTWSQDLGGFKETIKPGAFDRALRQKQDIRCLLNHDENIVLGRWKSGTLGITSDSVGLRFTVALPDTQAGRDVKTLVQRGDITQCSFAFKAVSDSWNSSRTQRTLLDVDLFDVSAVTYPAYEDTEVSARSRRPDYGIVVAAPTTDPELLAIRKRAAANILNIEAEEAEEIADIRNKALALQRRIAAEDAAYRTRNDSADVARMVRENQARRK